MSLPTTIANTLTGDETMKSEIAGNGHVHHEAVHQTSSRQREWVRAALNVVLLACYHTYLNNSFHLFHLPYHSLYLIAFSMGSPPRLHFCLRPSLPHASRLGTRRLLPTLRSACFRKGGTHMEEIQCQCHMHRLGKSLGKQDFCNVIGGTVHRGLPGVGHNRL